MERALLPVLQFSMAPSLEEKRSAHAEANTNDCAFRKLKAGRIRIPPEEIGFWPGSLQGHCVNGYDAHVVAHDLMTKTVCLARYSPLSLLEIPDHLLEQMKLENRQHCDKDALLPSFSPAMKYVVAKKQHFLAAVKLCLNESHRLYNESHKPIVKFSEDDPESKKIQSQGVLAQVYDKSIWADLEALYSVLEPQFFTNGLERTSTDEGQIINVERKERIMTGQKRHHPVAETKGVKRTLAESLTIPSPVPRRTPFYRFEPNSLGDGAHILSVSISRVGPLCKGTDRVVALWPQYSVSWKSTDLNSCLCCLSDPKKNGCKT